MENNNVIISGTITSQMTFSHESYDEKFYSFFVSVARQSGTADVLPILASEWLIDNTKDYEGKYIRIKGQFRSFNSNESKLILSVFADEIDFPEDYVEDENKIILDGFVCKEPTHRATPFGRIISDLMIAVNRPYKKSDYIPCICWGRAASCASSLCIGSQVNITGRIQSREYKKQINGSEESKVAYEVSVSKIIIK